MTSAKQKNNTIKFAQILTNSASFDKLYNEGMNLVEETASYLDDEGRELSNQFEENIYQFYSHHALQLTSQLMHLASWLLLHRAKRDQEMTSQEVVAERKNIEINLNQWDLKDTNWEEVPIEFLSLIYRTQQLQKRLNKLDDEMYNSTIKAVENPVATRLRLLSTALEQ